MAQNGAKIVKIITYHSFCLQNKPKDNTGYFVICYENISLTFIDRYHGNREPNISRRDVFGGPKGVNLKIFN